MKNRRYDMDKWFGGFYDEQGRLLKVKEVLDRLEAAGVVDDAAYSLDRKSVV